MEDESIGLGVNPDVNFEILKIIIASVLASTSIAWWIWIVYGSLEKLRSHQTGFVELLFECLRSLCVVLIFLTLIAFL